MFIPKIPNNTLTYEINQIVEFAKALHETRRFVFNHSASKNEIEKWEENNGIKSLFTKSDANKCLKLCRP